MFAQVLSEARVDSAPLEAGAPTNQQILQAAQKAYGEHQPAVDALVLACTAYVGEAAHNAALADLAAYPWSGGKPNAKLIAPVVGDTGIASALSGAGLASCLVGAVVADAHDLGITTNGMWSATSSPDAPTAVVSADVKAVLPGLQLPTPSLGVGLWEDAQAPSTSESGYAIVLPSPSYPVTLAIAVTSALATWGFLCVGGVTLGAVAVGSATLSPAS